MFGHKILTEFESIAHARFFSLTLLTISSGFAVLVTLFINQALGIPWYTALIPAYALQCAIIVLALNVYLRQKSFDEFAQKPTVTEIAEIIRAERLEHSKAELSAYYGRNHRLDILLKILSFLLDGSDFFLLTILKYLLLICVGVILLPYSFVFDAPLRCLSVLSESQTDRKVGYTSFLFSSLALGFFMFGLSVATWLTAWWFYNEGLFD